MKMLYYENLEPYVATVFIHFPNTVQFHLSSYVYIVPLQSSTHLAFHIHTCIDTLNSFLLDLQL